MIWRYIASKPRRKKLFRFRTWEATLIGSCFLIFIPARIVQAVTMTKIKKIAEIRSLSVKWVSSKQKPRFLRQEKRHSIPQRIKQLFFCKFHNLQGVYTAFLLNSKASCSTPRSAISRYSLPVIHSS